MGNQQSTVKMDSKIVTDIVNKSIMESTSQCSSSVAAQQNINLSASGDIQVGDIGQSQNVSLDFKCLNDNDVQSQIKNDIQSKLDAMLDQKLKGSPLFSNTNANNEQKTALITNVTNSLELRNLSTCQADASALQDINIETTDGGIVAGNITQEQGIELIASCTANQSAFQEAVNTLTQEVDASNKQVVENTQTGIIGIVAAVLAGLILLIIVVSLMRKSKQ